MRRNFQQQKTWGLIFNFGIWVAPISKPFLPVCSKKTNKSKLTKKNSLSCHYALNKFKIAELSLKSKLDLLQTAIDQQKSFRSLTLLIKKANELDATLKESPNSSTTSSVMERHSNLPSLLEKIEHEIDSVDDDGLLNQSSTRIRNDVSQMSNLTEMLTRTFIILQQNTSFPTETGETMPVFVWMPQNRLHVLKVFIWQQQESHYSKFIHPN